MFYEKDKDQYKIFLINNYDKINSIIKQHKFLSYLVVKNYTSKNIETFYLKQGLKNGSTAESFNDALDEVFKKSFNIFNWFFVFILTIVPFIICAFSILFFKNVFLLLTEYVIVSILSTITLVKIAKHKSQF